jgi:tRNA(Arg) A34 adenosine deaminase TadA
MGVGSFGDKRKTSAMTEVPDQRWSLVAQAMKRWALSWGDQPYGAAIVVGASVVGFGPSRVVMNSNPDAHAEREAIRDAQRRLSRQRLDGAILYSTSRPCRICEQAAWQAGVERMFFGTDLQDAGIPKP